MAHAGKCQVHRRHIPWVSDVEIHHIHPTGMGGPNTPDNQVDTCPTGHTNLHNLLRLALRGNMDVKDIPWYLRRKYSRSERLITETALRRIREHEGN